MTATDFDPPIGLAQRLLPGLARIVAPNPSPMTFKGTNTYVLGQGTRAVIDPGPDNDQHLSAILASLGGAPVSHVIVTHSHLDHSALAPRLAAQLNSPVLAFGDSDAGRSEVMKTLVAEGLVGGGEGVHRGFAPDQFVTDGTRLDGDDWTLEVLHTPGHMGNHIALKWQDRIFCGDLVMGWASSLVSPPDGDLSAFLLSCQRLLDASPVQLLPGHGEVIDDPKRRITWLMEHRASRSAQILDVLAKALATIPDLTAQIYADVPTAMHPAAARNVLAHLIHLHHIGAVAARPGIQTDAVFSLMDSAR